jgi:predicted nucleic acid-binding Zn ribbon protein
VVLKGKPSNTEICENCGGEARKVISPVGIMFKGSGYYTTDYRKSRDKKDKGKED